MNKKKILKSKTLKFKKMPFRKGKTFKNQAKTEAKYFVKLKNIVNKPYRRLEISGFVVFLQKVFFYRNLKKLIYKRTKTNDLNENIMFRGVSYIYNPKSPYEFQALKNVNLNIRDHKVIAVIGSTGSGKSTLIQHMNGLIIPSQGLIEVYDFSIYAKQKKIPKVKKLRQKIGVVFQFAEYQLFEETVLKDIMFGPICMGSSKELASTAAKKYIKMVGMAEEFLQQSPFDLSGGQKRRVAVAGVLAMECDTLVLDEPTAGLDPEGAKTFVNLFRELNQKRGKRIILVTHNMDHVLELADQVVVMDEGEIITIDSPSKVFAQLDVMHSLNIELPKIQKMMVKLKENNIVDLMGQNIISVSELAKKIGQTIKIKT